MKKKLCLILFLILTIFSSFFLTSCKKKEVEPDVEIDDIIDGYNPWEGMNNGDVIPQDKYDAKYDVHYAEVPVMSYFGSSDGYEILNAVYSDDVFLKDSNVYNHFLGRMSIGLALSSYTLELTDKKYVSNDLFGFLVRCGFDDFSTEQYYQETSQYTVASLIGSKKIEKDGEEFTLIGIGIRSGKYYNEWMSNFEVEDGNLHQGFNYAASLVVERVLSYILQYNITGKVKCWVAGFSRGAAISNLVASKLNNIHAIGKENVYAYTFATPRGVKEIDDNSKYDNIFNILGPSDPVTQFAPADWEYKRYGKDLYLPGSEFNSNFSYIYSRVQEFLSKFNFTTYYSAGLNLRIRLLLGYLTEFSKDSSQYSSYIQGELIRIIGQKSLNNIVEGFSSIIGKYSSFDGFNEKDLNNLVDYILGIGITLNGKNGYLKDEKGSSTNQFRLLMHEHYPELYYGMMYYSSEEELFHTNDKFAYVMLDKNAEYDLYNTENNKLVLSINNKGERILSDYAKDNHLEIPVLNFKSYNVLVLPYDLNYELKYSGLKKDSEIKYVECARNFTTNLTLNSKKINSGDGVALKVNSEAMVDSASFNSESIKASGFATMLKINKAGLTWKVKLIYIAIGITLLISIIPVLSYGVFTLISKKKFRLSVVLNAILLVGVAVEEELSYWFFRFNIFLFLLWKVLLVIGIVLSIVLYRKHRNNKQFYIGMTPFLFFGLAVVFLIDTNMEIALYALALASVSLFIYFFMLEKPNTRQIAIGSAITIILEAINFLIIYRLVYSFAQVMAFAIPFISMIMVMALNKGPHRRFVAYSFVLTIVLLAAYYLAVKTVMPHLLFKISLFASLIIASFADIHFNKEVEPAKIEEENEEIKEEVKPETV